MRAVRGSELRPPRAPFLAAAPVASRHETGARIPFEVSLDVSFRTESSHGSPTRIAGALGGDGEPRLASLQQPVLLTSFLSPFSRAQAPGGLRPSGHVCLLLRGLLLSAAPWQVRRF